MINFIQKIIYNNRTYICDGSEKNLDMFRIEEQTIEPESFTKYYSIKDYNIEALLNNYIYASHPKGLNNPFDCYSKLIDTSEITENEIDYIEKRLPIIIPRDYYLNQNHREEFIEILYELLFKNCGVISLTDSKNQNPSLWKNHTNNHKGFSVSFFGTSLKEIAMGPFKVDYVETLEKLKYESKYFNALILWLTCVKSKFWSNEEEWRFIYPCKDTMYIPKKHYGSEEEITKQNRKLYLPKNAIKEVTLGFYFFDSENMTKNNRNEIVVDLSKEKDSELKIKLLNYVYNNNIPLSISVLMTSEFKFHSSLLDYEFNNDTETFKFKEQTHNILLKS